VSEEVISLATAAAQVLSTAMVSDDWERTRDGLAGAAGLDVPVLDASRRRVLDVDAADRADRVRQAAADWRYELIGHLAADPRRARAVERWMWSLTEDTADAALVAVPAPRRPLVGRLFRRR
jgi:hypothetical protein